MPSIQVSGVGATIAICGSGVSAGADTCVGAVVIGSVIKGAKSTGIAVAAVYAGCIMHIVIQVGISVIAIQSFCVIANGAGASVGSVACRYIISSMIGYSVYFASVFSI